MLLSTQAQQRTTHQRAGRKVERQLPLLAGHLPHFTLRKGRNVHERQCNVQGGNDELVRMSIHGMESRAQGFVALHDLPEALLDRKSTRLNSSHSSISYA